MAEKSLKMCYTIWETVLLVGGSIVAGMVFTHIAYYFTLKGGI